MHLEMIEPLRLSIVLCAKDTSVEEDKKDDEPEHGLGNKEYKYDHDDVDDENNDHENHDDDYEGADEDKEDDDPEHGLDNDQDESQPGISQLFDNFFSFACSTLHEKAK